MKQLQKQDLKEGGIYIAKQKVGVDKYIVKITNNMCSCFNIYSYNKFLYRNGNFSSISLNFYEATLEEKHWLEECIKADKFISYEEAMKTFVPEFTLPEKWYIKARLLNDNQLQKLVIYLILINKDGATYSVKNIKKWYPFIGSDIGAHYITNPYFVNDSYREITFDQFEKYVLKGETITTKATVETKSKFIDNNTVETNEGSIFKVGDLVTPFEGSSPNKGKKFKITGFRWNNAQTEICAITELHKPNGIGVDKLEIYIEPKVKENLTLLKNLCVEVSLIKEESLLDKAKRLYPVGTKYKNAGNTNSVYTVVNQSFSEFNIDTIYGEYNKGCLFYENQWAEVIEYPHGFKVGDKIKVKHWHNDTKPVIITKIEGNQLFFEYNVSFTTNNNSVLAKNAIKVDDFVLPEKWCIKDIPEVKEYFEEYNNGNYTCNGSAYLHFPRIKDCCYFKGIVLGYTEITFEQFKKYVLNETV
jgi:hypothetical protein